MYSLFSKHIKKEFRFLNKSKLLIVGNGPLKNDLNAYLTKFIEYYGDITIDTIDVIKIDDSLEEDYDELYDDRLHKFHSDVDITQLTDKKLDLYKLIDALEQFIYEKKK